MNPLQQFKPSHCGNCGFKDYLLLHSVRHRGEFRQLCTSCVLKLHPSFFCPICFQVFDQPPPSHERVTCQKCPSITHPGCVPGLDNLSRTYVCPPCANPGFSYLNFKRDGGRGIEIDLRASRVLLCAANIAVVSMSRAVSSAESDAKRKVKDAAESKKKAKVALEQVFEMYAREKGRRIEGQASAAAVAASNGGGSGSGVEMNGVGSIEMNGAGVGVGSSIRERIGIAASSGVGGIGSSGSFGVQNRAVGGTGMTMGTRGVVLGSGGGGGGSNVVRIDDKKGVFVNGDVTRRAANLSLGNGSVVRAVNLSNAGNASHAGGGNGLTSATPADGGQGRQC